mmetsp:Transcript_21563/g.56206  ORF Transcript_21563/g.56206 Transcript_21563/m.56206 type:complete len:260 (+) Transcript_21563:442-1221(+)
MWRLVTRQYLSRRSGRRLISCGRSAPTAPPPCDTRSRRPSPRHALDASPSAQHRRGPLSTNRYNRVGIAQPEMPDNCLEISTPGGAPFHLQLARGTVQCKECAKPRVIFSLRAPSKMQPSHTSEEQPPSKADIAACMRIAKDVLQDAIASQDYVCGGQPLPEEHPFHDIFNTAQDLECHMHVEPQFYSKRGRTPQVASWSNPSLCSQCVGGLEATVAEGIPFSTILPLCDKCRGEGVKYPVRSRIRMSQARAAIATHAA